MLHNFWTASNTRLHLSHGHSIVELCNYLKGIIKVDKLRRQIYDTHVWIYLQCKQLHWCNIHKANFKLTKLADKQTLLQTALNLAATTDFQLSFRQLLQKSQHYVSNTYHMSLHCLITNGHHPHKMRYRKHTHKSDYDKDDYENDYQYWNLQ